MYTYIIYTLYTHIYIYIYMYINHMYICIQHTPMIFLCFHDISMAVPSFRPAQVAMEAPMKSKKFPNCDERR